MKAVEYLRFFAVSCAVVIFGLCVVTMAQSAEMAMRNIDGSTVNLTDLKGKVVILDFFATYCPPCKKGIPEFVKLQEQYGSDKFTVLGISTSGLSDTKQFAQRFGINYPVLIDNGSTASMFGPVRLLPTTYVLNKDLKVVRKYIGFKPKEIFEADIEALLR